MQQEQAAPAGAQEAGAGPQAYLQAAKGAQRREGQRQGADCSAAGAQEAAGGLRGEARACCRGSCQAPARGRARSGKG